MTRRSRIPLVFGASLLAPAAFGQAVDTSEWACEFCPFDDGNRADVAVGASGVSDDNAYFGNATGYDEKGAYANVDGRGSYASDEQQLRWVVEDLGLSSRYAALDGGNQGKYGYNLAWRELPQRRFITTSTVFNQASGDTLTLPSGWVRAPLTSGFTQLGASLVPRTIESDRAILDVGGHYRPTSRIMLSADYRRQERDGVKIYGGSSFSNASLLPMPFDHATDEVDIGIRYADGNAFVSLDWYLSDFQNSNASLTWDQPFTTAPGAETVALAQAPDSRMQRLTFAGGYSFPAARTVMSVSASTGSIEQNATLLPYTTNPNVPTTPLPRNSLNGDIETSSFAFGVHSRPAERFSFRASYRFDDRDNKTSLDLWERVVVDTLTSSPELNIPYSFERSTFKISGDFDAFDTLRLSAGYERRDIDRDLQEVASQSEDTGWGRARFRPTRTFEFDARGGTAKREIDEYNETIAQSFGQNPLMRKYNLAYRYRRFGELRTTWSPMKYPLSFGLNGRYADDDYTFSQLGVTDGKEIGIAFDFGWSISDRAAVYFNSGVDEIRSKQLGSGSFATPDWTARNDDEFTTIGAGFHIDRIADKFDLNFDVMTSEGKSDIVLTSNANGSDPFPSLQTQLDYVRLKLGYQHSVKLGFDLNLGYQQFSTEDWALEGVAPDTIPLVLSLGAAPYDEDVYIVGLSFRYRVGAD